LKKFSALLTIVIESSYLGTNFKIKDFGIEPKVPKTLNDLANYVAMIYQILFAKNNGLQKYNKKLKLELKLLWTDNSLLLNNISNLLKKKITLEEFNKNLRDNKKNFSINIGEDFKKFFAIEININNSFKMKINPWEIAKSGGDWQRTFIHDLLHVIINPETVAKFQQKEFGKFDEPTGYTHDELLEELFALVTDHYNKKNLKLINFRSEEEGAIPDEVGFPFFLNILRNVIIQKKLTPEKEHLIQFNEIKEKFNKYPVFQKILQKVIKFIPNYKNGIKYKPSYFNNNYYSNIDKKILTFTQASLNWGIKENQKPVELEGKLTDFSNHISDTVKRYNVKT
jgi:hypothetical protein